MLLLSTSDTPRGNKEGELWKQFPFFLLFLGLDIFLQWNNLSSSMNIYTKKVSDITKTAGRANRSMRKHFVAPQLYSAGMELLDRIHAEEPGIGATQSELEEEQEMFRQIGIAEKMDKPELTMEYLKSIGLDRYCIWGSK